MKSKYKLSLGLNDCSNEEYHSDSRFLSSSNLKLILKDLSKFKDEFIDGNKKYVTNSAFDEGNYVHSAILERHTVDDLYAFFPGFRKIGKEWDEFKLQNNGKILLSKPQKHRMDRLISVYENHPCAKSVLDGGEAELSLAGEFLEVPIKVRADYINLEKGYIADIKTTSMSTDVDTFKYVVSSLYYDLSCALYCKMFELYYGKKFDFYFVVLGKKDYTCDVYKVSSETMLNGEAMVVKALNMYKKCLKSGIWSSESLNSNLNDNNYEILEV